MKPAIDAHYASIKNELRSGVSFPANSIPVRIHILQDSPGNGRSIDSNGIVQVINRLNTDFAATGFQFYKCGNINYITNGAYNDIDFYTEFTQLYNTTATANIINIYFVRDLMFGGSAAAGVAPTPGGRDYILMRGGAALGNITHEAGHYFGLLHTHGVSNTERSKEKVDGSNCGEEGDFFCDTPADPNQLNVTFTNCIYTGTWGDLNGQAYSPDVSNHMSYAPANCRTHFSNEQTAFMYWVYHEYRSYLQCSSIKIDFTYIAPQVCDSPYTVTFTNTSVGLSSYQWDVNEDDITDYTATNATHTFTQPGIKYVHLKGTQSGKTYHRHKKIEMFKAKTVPAYESFNAAALQDGWRLLDMDNGRGWELAKAMGPDGRLSNMLRFRNYAYISSTAEDQVYSTTYNLTGLQNARLSFDIAYAPSSKTDSLKIYISTDCGKTYNQLIFYAWGDSLKSAPKTYSEFEPTSQTWKTITINLTPYINNYVRFKIENVNTGGNTLYIDNFRIDGGDGLKNVGFTTSRVAFYEGNASIVEGCRKYHLVQVPMHISAVPSAPVTATISTAGNAKKGHDYILLDSVVVFPSGSSATKYIRVKIYDDASVEATENVVLNITQVTGNSFTASSRSNSCLVEIFDNEPISLQTAVVDTVLFFDGFNNQTTFVPAGWSMQSDCPTCPQSGVVDSLIFWCTTGAAGGWLNSTESLDSTDYMIMWALDAYKGVPLGEYLITPAMNSAGYDSVILSFDNVFEKYPGMGFEKIGVEVWNGSQWVSVWSHIEYNGNLGKFYQPYRKCINVSAYANANFKARFSFTGADYGYYWALDNVKVQAWRTGYKIATQLNSSATVYLGPNDTVQVTNNHQSIATITNKSNWNYGCTVVTIDRAGTGALPYEVQAAPHLVTEKTLHVAPASNNANGQYSIALYYTPQEMNGWLVATGNPMQQMSIIKTSGPVKNITPSNPNANGPTNQFCNAQQLTAYNDGWELTGNFYTGFSGFGGGHPSLSGLLPVKYSEPLTGEYHRGIGIILRWSTFIELDNDYFNIERSTDGIEYKSIGIVKGQGNSSVKHEYDYLDKDYESGINYYRLMQVDFDGAEEFSNIAAINADVPDTPMLLYPNPAMDVVTVLLSAPKGVIYVVDELGNAVITKPVQANNTNINLAGLSKGIYTVSFRDGLIQQNIRLIKM
ncbi:MAG TPA: T9SS type A sorting domain-containing protein [Chitinophagales bacterium]|nr:T9SS type A sorting domain-containing protein [Chitinophagales bacterium]